MTDEEIKLENVCFCLCFSGVVDGEKREVVVVGKERRWGVGIILLRPLFASSLMLSHGGCPLLKRC